MFGFLIRVGNIQSLDERPLQAFDKQLVTMEIGGSVVNSDYGGFDIVSTNVKKAYADGWWVGAQDPIVYDRFTDMSANGVACLRYSSTGGITDKKIYAKTFLANGAVAPAGPYIEKIKVYVPEGTTMTAFRTYMAAPTYSNTWDISGVAKDKWVTLSKTVQFDAQPTQKYGIDINTTDNPGVTGDQLIYFDTMELIPLESRPTE